MGVDDFGFLGVKIIGGTFFLNYLWMASSASLMVTPLRVPCGVPPDPRREVQGPIFLTGGVVSIFFRGRPFSSRVDGEVLKLPC